MEIALTHFLEAAKYWQEGELFTRTDFEGTAALIRQKLFPYSCHDMLLSLLSCMGKLTLYRAGRVLGFHLMWVSVRLSIMRKKC